MMVDTLLIAENFIPALRMICLQGFGKMILMLRAKEEREKNKLDICFFKWRGVGWKNIILFGCCGFFGFFGRLLNVVLPDISLVSVASIFRGLE